MTYSFYGKPLNSAVVGVIKFTVCLSLFLPIFSGPHMEYSGHYNLVEAPSVHFYALYKNDKGENLPISYTYSEAKTICAYHGLQLSSTTKEGNKEHLALFAYDRISQSEHGLYWNMTQSNGYQLTETRGQIICQVPRTYKGIKL